MKKAKFIQVCDIPFCDEPEELYWKRIEEGLTIIKLRAEASEILKKSLNDLTKEDYLITELERWPFPVSHYFVKYKKYKGRWILSCTCPSWIYNHSGERTCKHTKLAAAQLNIPEKIC